MARVAEREVLSLDDPAVLDPAVLDGAVLDAAVLDPRGVHQLAAELHDGLCQQLFAAELELHELRCLPDLSPAAREVVERLGRRLATGSGQLRSVLLATLAVEAPLAAAPGVVDGAAELLESFGRLHPIRTSLVLQGSGGKPAVDAAAVLVRAVREGLANIGKHASATRVSVTIRRSRRSWTVEINDDGAGDPACIRNRAVGSRSFGLTSLGTDAARVGGALTLAASPELGGLQLRVCVPVAVAPDLAR